MLWQRHAAETHVVVYFEADDVAKTVRMLKKRGLQFEMDPVDQTWLRREASLRDPAGNRICVYKAGQNRRYPPWRIKSKSD